MKQSIYTYTRQVSWRECPHLLTDENMRAREAIIAARGADSAFVRSMMDGEFVRSDSDNLVYTERDVQALIRAMRKENKPAAGPRMAAIDLSGGGDEQTLMIAEGGRVYIILAFRESDTDWLAKKLVEILRAERIDPHRCTVDNNGIGLPIINSMEGMGYRPVFRYMNNQRPINTVEYYDKASEDHYTFKTLLHQHCLEIPVDYALLDQFRKRIAINMDECLKLETKTAIRKRGGDSPDRLDTLIMLYSRFRPEIHNVAPVPEPDRPWLRQRIDGEIRPSGFAGLPTRQRLASIIKPANRISLLTK